MIPRIIEDDALKGLEESVCKVRPGIGVIQVNSQDQQILTRKDVPRENLRTGPFGLHLPRRKDNSAESAQITFSFDLLAKLATFRTQPSHAPAAAPSLSSQDQRISARRA